MEENGLINENGMVSSFFQNSLEGESPGSQAVSFCWLLYPSRREQKLSSNFGFPIESLRHFRTALPGGHKSEKAKRLHFNVQPTHLVSEVTIQKHGWI